MGLLNYTTDVPTSRTVAEIAKILSSKGARSITHEYDGVGAISGVTFSIVVGSSLLTYSLPANVDAVFDKLCVQRRGQKSRAQAERVAWRILKDWIEAQMALIETGQAAMDQVFLPYMQERTGRTFYQLWTENRQLQLGSGEKNQALA